MMPPANDADVDVVALATGTRPSPGGSWRFQAHAAMIK